MSGTSNNGVEISRVYPSQLQKHVTERHLVFDGNIEDISTSVSGLIFQDTAGILSTNLSLCSYEGYFSKLLLLEQNLQGFGGDRKEFYFIKGEGTPITVRVEKILNQELFQKVSDEIIKSVEETGTFSDDHSEAYKFLMGTDEESQEDFSCPHLYPIKIQDAFRYYLLKKLSLEIIDLFDMSKLELFLSREEINFLHGQIESRNSSIPGIVALKEETISPIGIGFTKLSEDKKNLLALFIKLFNISGDVFNPLAYRFGDKRTEAFYTLVQTKEKFVEKNFQDFKARFGFDILSEENPHIEQELIAA